jgi:cbb3-type cytochrome oxidase maturation protein
MDILYVLIPLSVVLVFAMGVVFWWALENGQFEDLEGPAYRILVDDDAPARRPDLPACAASGRTRSNEHDKR